MGEKENEKLVAEGQKTMKPKELDERLKVADELADKFKDERKRKKIEAEGKSPSIEKFEQQLEKLDTRIASRTKMSRWGHPRSITSIPASPSSSPRSSTSPSSASSPRPYARSSNGPSSLWMRIGSFRFPFSLPFLLLVEHSLRTSTLPMRKRVRNGMWDL